MLALPLFGAPAAGRLRASAAASPSARSRPGVAIRGLRLRPPNPLGLALLSRRNRGPALRRSSPPPPPNNPRRAPRAQAPPSQCAGPGVSAAVPDGKAPLGGALRRAGFCEGRTAKAQYPDGQGGCGEVVTTGAVGAGTPARRRPPWAAQGRAQCSHASRGAEPTARCPGPAPRRREMGTRSGLAGCCGSPGWATPWAWAAGAS